MARLLLGQGPHHDIVLIASINGIRVSRIGLSLGWGRSRSCRLSVLRLWLRVGITTATTTAAILLLVTTAAMGSAFLVGTILLSLMVYQYRFITCMEVCK